MIRFTLDIAGGAFLCVRLASPRLDIRTSCLYPTLPMSYLTPHFLTPANPRVVPPWVTPMIPPWPTLPLHAQAGPPSHRPHALCCLSTRTMSPSMFVPEKILLGACQVRGPVSWR